MYVDLENWKYYKENPDEMIETTESLITNKLSLSDLDLIILNAIKHEKPRSIRDLAKKINKDVIADAIVKFGEDIDEPMYLFVNPAQYAELRKDADFVHIANGEAVINGQVGMIHGCNIVVANRVEAGKAFIMKQGALALVMKRNVMVEADRNILAGTNVFACNEHYAVQLRYDDRVVRIEK